MDNTKRCGCKRHGEFIEGKSSFSLKVLAHRPEGYRKGDIDFLIRNGWLTTKCKHLCTVCNERARELNDNSDGASLAKKSRINYNINEVISDIESNKVPEEDLLNLASALGKSQSETFKTKAKDTTKLYKDNLTDIKQLELDESSIVITFLMALVGLTNESVNKGRCLALFAAIDCLLAASTAGTITPLFFTLNLILYFVAGSKTIISYLQCGQHIFPTLLSYSESTGLFYSE